MHNSALMNDSSFHQRATLSRPSPADKSIPIRTNDAVSPTNFMICFRSSLPVFSRIHNTFHIQLRTMKVVPVPVRDDNYAYLLIDESTNKAAAVDPYDVGKVAAAAQAHGVEIVAGITTHHHFDHSGGNEVCFLYSMPKPSMVD